MAKDSFSSHHLSSGGKSNPSPPIHQHKRMALGEKVNGQSNPNGAARGATDKKINATY